MLLFLIIFVISVDFTKINTCRKSFKSIIGDIKYRKSNRSLSQ